MRHQFIGGPLNGKVKIFLSDEEALAVPWEKYFRVAEVKATDEVLQLIIWQVRDEVLDADQVESALNREPDVSVVGQRSPVEGGYPTVAATLDKTTIEPRITVDEHVSKMRLLQSDAESRVSADALRLRGYMESVSIADGSMNASPAMVPDPPSAEAVDADAGEDTDSGQPEASSLETRRKAAGFQKWEWGPKLRDGGSTSVGKAIESSSVSLRQAKNLGFDSPDAVYEAAEALLVSLGY